MPIRRRQLVALSLGLPLAAAGQSTPTPRRFDLQGHRGARGVLPENTLQAFAYAMSIGVDTLELDIAITRDGVLLVHHDRTLNPDITRGPDGQFLPAGKGPAIVELAAAEIARFDVGRIRPGSKYASDFPDQKPVDGARIPRLGELFDAVRKAGNEKVRFAIETKVSPLAPAETLAPEPFAQAVVAAIRAAGMQHRSAILSFDWRTLQVAQKLAPEIPTVYITSLGSTANYISRNPNVASAWSAGFRLADHGGSVPRMIKAAGGHTWSSYHQDLTPALVQEAQALGLNVLAWTVNAPDRIAQVMDLGVDGIVTDYPQRVRAEMAKRGMALPS